MPTPNGPKFAVEKARARRNQPDACEEAGSSSSPPSVIAIRTAEPTRSRRISAAPPRGREAQRVEQQPPDRFDEVVGSARISSRSTSSRRTKRTCFAAAAARSARWPRRRPRDSARRAQSRAAHHRRNPRHLEQFLDDLSLPMNVRSMAPSICCVACGSRAAEPSSCVQPRIAWSGSPEFVRERATSTGDSVEGRPPRTAAGVHPAPPDYRARLTRAYNVRPAADSNSLSPPIAIGPRCTRDRFDRATISISAGLAQQRLDRRIGRDDRPFDEHETRRATIRRRCETIDRGLVRASVPP